MTATLTPNAALAPVPPSVLEEEREAIAIREENLTRMALINPNEIEARLQARETTLAKLRAVAIKSSHAFDWTLYKDKDGRVVGVVRDSAAVQIRKWLGISVFNYRPLVAGIPQPQITREKVQKGDSVEEVTIVEMWADASCNLTGETIESIYYAVRSDRPFTGSGSLQDLIASCRTGLDAKATRLLSGLRKVPEDMLKQAGVDTSKSHGGMGFGTSSERTAGKVADEGVSDKAAQLRAEILRVVGGDGAAAKKLCKEITAGDKPGKDGKMFPGWDSVDRLTQGWQVDNALAKLKKHPMYSNPAEREAGEEG